MESKNGLKMKVINDRTADQERCICAERGDDQREVPSAIDGCRFIRGPSNGDGCQDARVDNWNIRLESVQLLRPKEVATLGIAAVQTLARWRHEGKGPPFIKVGRQVRYPAGALRAWIKCHAQ